jgi:predicted DNA-binding ArsR family transcriptional regulator
MEKYIIELTEIRMKLMQAIEQKDELYALMQVNNIDTLLYEMNKQIQTLQASTDKSKLYVAAVSKRSELLKFLEWFDKQFHDKHYPNINEGIIDRYLKL